MINLIFFLLSIQTPQVIMSIQQTTQQITQQVPKNVAAKILFCVGSVKGENNIRLLQKNFEKNKRNSSLFIKPMADLPLEITKALHKQYKRNPRACCVVSFLPTLEFLKQVELISDDFKCDKQYEIVGNEKIVRLRGVPMVLSFNTTKKRVVNFTVTPLYPKKSYNICKFDLDLTEEKLANFGITRSDLEAVDFGFKENSFEFMQEHHEINIAQLTAAIIFSSRTKLNNYCQENDVQLSKKILDPKKSKLGANVRGGVMDLVLNNPDNYLCKYDGKTVEYTNIQTNRKLTISFGSYVKEFEKYCRIISHMGSVILGMMDIRDDDNLVVHKREELQAAVTSAIALKNVPQLTSGSTDNKRQDKLPSNEQQDNHSDNKQSTKRPNKRSSNKRSAKHLSNTEEKPTVPVPTNEETPRHNDTNMFGGFAHNEYFNPKINQPATDVFENTLHKSVQHTPPPDFLDFDDSRGVIQIIPTPVDSDQTTSSFPDSHTGNNYIF